MTIEYPTAAATLSVPSKRETTHDGARGGCPQRHSLGTGPMPWNALFAVEKSPSSIRRRS